MPIENNLTEIMEKTKIKMKINEMSVKYIECDHCSFEKSCLLPEDDAETLFHWTCPHCAKRWAGQFRENGELFLESVEESSHTVYILIEMEENFVPWMVLVQPRVEHSGEKTKSGVSVSLKIISAESDKITNPRNFPQYRAVMPEHSVSSDNSDRKWSEFLPEKLFGKDFSD